MQSYYVDQNVNTNKLQISSGFISLVVHQRLFKCYECNYCSSVFNLYVWQYDDD